MSTARQVVGLIGWLVLCFAAAGIGGMVTAPAIPGWYAQLAKPAWNPPAAVFGPVWSVLYALMAVAAWLVWRQARSANRGALGLFLVQLALNLAWSLIFFGLHSPALALVDICLLWAAILLTLLAFHRASRWGAALLAPYLAWVSFALVLNLAVWRLNL